MSIVVRTGLDLLLVTLLILGFANEDKFILFEDSCKEIYLSCKRRKIGFKAFCKIVKDAIIQEKTEKTLRKQNAKKLHFCKKCASKNKVR